MGTVLTTGCMLKFSWLCMISRDATRSLFWEGNKPFDRRKVTLVKTLKDYKDSCRTRCSNHFDFFGSLCATSVLQHIFFGRDKEAFL